MNFFSALTKTVSLFIYVFVCGFCLFFKTVLLYVTALAVLELALVHQAGLKLTEIIFLCQQREKSMILSSFLNPKSVGPDLVNKVADAVAKYQFHYP